MKLFVQFNEQTLTRLAEKRLEENKDAIDDLNIAIATVKGTGFDPCYRQPLMTNFNMLIGHAATEKVEALRKIPHVLKVVRADGKKMTEPE